MSHPLTACLLLAGLIPAGTTAAPTEITVRVFARHAMYVGDLVDGAQVTITDAVSGEVLAQRVTKGDAGDPRRIMDDARKRGAPMAVAGDASFSATLDLDEPRYLQVTAFGPSSGNTGVDRLKLTVEE